MFDNIDDPKKQMLLAMGLGLLGGKSANFGRNLSEAGLLGLNAYSSATTRKAKLAEEEQQRQMREMQMAQMKKAQEDQAYAAQIAPQFFNAGSPGVDQAGNEMGVPPSAPKHDLAGYGMALAGRNPSMGMPFIQAGMKDNTPLQVKPGESLVDRNTYKPVFTAPDKPHWVDAGDKIIPVGPDGRPVGAPIPKNMAPGEAQRIGMEGTRLGMDKARLGMEAGRYNYEIGGGQGLPQKQLDAIAADIGKKQAETQYQAKQDLPQAEAEAKTVTDLVDKLVKHPGFKTSVGAKGPTGAMAAIGAPIPGTDAADFVTLRNQIVGKQFMQAFQTLKGGGQITEREGEKATEAMARMSMAQSEKEFIQGAEDFKSVIAAGIERQRKKAGSSGASGGWGIQRVR